MEVCESEALPSRMCGRDHRRMGAVPGGCTDCRSCSLPTAAGSTELADFLSRL